MEIDQQTLSEHHAIYDHLAKDTGKTPEHCAHCGRDVLFVDETKSWFSRRQIVCGAVSPQLVWEGAQKTDMTTLELAQLASKNPGAVADLMWL